MGLVAKIKRVLSDWIVNTDALKRPSIKYCAENELLPSVIVRTPSDVARRLFNLPISKYQTQLNQDLFALLMNRFEAGFFVEIGANDGFTLSNTIYLESCFEWRGILVEANPKYVPSLRNRKNSVVVNKAIFPKKGRVEFVDAGLYGGVKSSLDDRYSEYMVDASCISVDCIELGEMLDENEAPGIIDFISIDVEGGEVPIVEMMVSASQRFRCGCIEYNGRMEDYERIAQLLESSGYKLVWDKQTIHDIFFIDGASKN